MLDRLAGVGTEVSSGGRVVGGWLTASGLFGPAFFFFFLFAPCPSERVAAAAAFHAGPKVGSGFLGFLACVVGDHMVDLSSGET